VKGSSQKCQIGRTSSAVPFELHALFLPTTRETLDLVTVSPVRGQHRGGPRNDRRDFVHAKCHPLIGPLGIANGSAIRARVRVSLSRSSSLCPALLFRLMQSKERSVLRNGRHNSNRRVLCGTAKRLRLQLVPSGSQSADGHSSCSLPPRCSAT